MLKEQYIKALLLMTEAKKKAKKDKEEKVSSNTAGVLHELLVGYHLRGGEHMNKHPSVDRESPKEAHDRLKSTISREQYDKINRKAKAAADDIKKKVSRHGKIHDVHWTSNKGDIERSTGIASTQDEDSGDIVVHTKKGKKTTYHSVSLKVTDKKSGNVPVSNPGMQFTHGGGAILEKHREEIKKRYPKIASLSSKKERKEYLKNNPKIDADVRSRNAKTKEEIVAHMHKKLSALSSNELVNHIRHVIKAKPTPMQKRGHHHIRHTTYGDNSAHSTDPSTSHEHILKDAKNITVDRSGTSIVFKHKGKAFARHRIKFESESDPMSSVKGSGELMGSQGSEGNPKKKKKTVNEDVPVNVAPTAADSGNIQGYDPVMLRSALLRRKLKKQLKESKDKLRDKLKGPLAGKSKKLEPLKDRIARASRGVPGGVDLKAWMDDKKRRKAEYMKNRERRDENT